MSFAAHSLINGQPGDQLSVADRAVQYGDGLFETLSCCDGQPRWLALHWERLRQGCERLQLPFADFQALSREVASLAAGQPRCIVKVIISRGIGRRRGYRPTGQEAATRLVSRHEWPAEEDTAALRAGLSPVQLGTNPMLAGLKHLNRLEQVLAQLSKPADLDEVLMLSSTRHVISGSMSNVFFANDSGLFTPDLRECGVAGVMRRVVLESVLSSQTWGPVPRNLGGAVRQGRAAASIAVRHVVPEELASVREAFLTNVRWGVRSISQLDGRALPSDDYAQQLRRLV